MIEIISFGKLDRYVEKCSKCECVFSFDFSDLDSTYEGVFNNPYNIKCPRCGTKIFFTKDRLSKQLLSKD